MGEAKKSPGRVRGRRPGANLTRQAILDAARARFAEQGFARTTVRAIATDADVDPALVIRFFGSKDELFAATLAVPPAAVARLDEAFAGPSGSLGEEVVRTFLQLWEDPGDDGQRLRAMYRSAVSVPHAAEKLRDYVQHRLQHAVGPRLSDHGDAAVRAGLASSMMLGVLSSRLIVEVPLLADLDHDYLVRTLAPAIQQLLTGGSTPEV